MAEAAALIVSALAAAAGSIGSAVSRNNAKKRAEDYLNSEYNRDPLSTVGTRSLLKSYDQRDKDQLEGMRNRAIAGGATVENQLAARKMQNETRSDMYSKLLQGEDARRNTIRGQRENLAQTAMVQDAQNWQAWGAQTANASLQWGSSQLLGKQSSPTAADIDDYIMRNNLKTYSV